MQYKRLDPSRGLSDHLYELKAQLRANDTAPTGDVGLSGQIVATDPDTGVETIIGRLPDGSTGIRQWVNDITPPGQPSTPSGTPTIGGAIITWDGRDSGGAGQPEDYDRTEIEYSADGTIWAHGGTLYGANSQTVPSLTNGTLYYFRLISYDKNNNASAASVSVTVTPVSAVDNPDVESALQTLRNKDTELTTGVQTAQGDASQAIQDALTAFNTANGVPTTFYGPTQPPVDAERAFVVGDKWFDTDDNNKLYVWNGTDFILAIDAQGTVDSTLANLGINDAWVADIEAQADRAIDTFFGTTTPTGMQSGDLWLTGVAGEPMKRYDGTNWVVFEDPNIQSAYQEAIDATSAAEKALKSARSYINPAISTAGILNKQGSTPTIVDSPTAMGGKALQKSGVTHNWLEDRGSIQAIDPNLLYRFTIRARVVTPTTVTGGRGLYYGAVGFADENGDVYVNATGANNYGGQQWASTNEILPGTGEWKDYVTYYQGIAVGNKSGFGTLESPTKFQNLTKYFCPGMILDYNTGNGVWEVSHWSVDAIDPIGYQALLDAEEARGIADSKIRTYAEPTAPTGLTSIDSGDLWIDTDNGRVSRWTGSIWLEVVDNGSKAASDALTSLGLDQAFVDTVNSLEDTAITTFYGATTPVGPKEGDLWLTGNGIDPMQRWTNGAWIKYENPAVESAYTTAGDAEALADKKVVTYAQAAPPAGTVDLPLRTGDLWVDTDDTNKLYRYVQGTGAGTGWIVLRDTGIAAAQDTANTAIKATAFSGNPSFDDWTSTLPNGFTTFTTAPTKETVTVRVPKNAARWNVLATGTQAGLQFAPGTIAGHLPNLEYYTVELEFYLVSGTLSGSGVILDWYGMTANGTGSRSVLSLASEFPNGVNTGKWYRVTKTLRRPVGSIGTWTSMAGYLMANWSGFGGAVKNVIFDWFNLRPATAEEITAYGVPAAVLALNESIATKGKTIIQSAEPAVGDRLAQNLWIDTTVIGDPALPGNIPKRWTGSAWEAVTEKAVVDAANDAANAQRDATQALTDAGLAMTAAGQRSRIVHLDTTPVVPEGGWKNGDVWYKHLTSSITSPIIDWYIWNGAWELQTLDEAFFPLLNIGAGTYGTLNGTRLEADSVSSESLIVGDFTNLWQNPDFETDTVGQQAKGLTPNASVLVVAGGANGSGKALSLAARSPGNQDVYDNNLIPVKPKDELFLSAFGKFANTAGTGIGGLGFRLYDANRVHLNWNRLISFTTKTTTWPVGPTTASYLVPDNVHFIQPWATFSDNGETTNSFQIDDIEIRRKNKGVLIVDGAFDARTITGALIQSRSEANRGIKLTSAHLVAYNDIGTETLRFDGTNSIITGAVVRTAATGARLQIDSSSLRAWNDLGEEYFNVTNGEVNLTGVTNTKGLTHNLYGSKPINTSVGSVGIYAPGSNTYSNLPGIEWELIEDPDTMMSYPSIVSYSGKDISLTGGVTPDGKYAEIDLWSDIGDINIQASRTITLQPNTGNINLFGNVLADQVQVGTGFGRALINIANDTLAGTWFSIDGGSGGDEPAIYADTARNLHIRSGVSSHINFRTSLSMKDTIMGAPGAAGLTYANGWSDFGTGYAPVKTILVSEGTVALSGMTKPGTRTDGVILGYVDPAVRPKTHQYLECTIRAGSAQYAGMLRVGTDGSLHLYSGGNHASISYLAIGSIYNLI